MTRKVIAPVVLALAGSVLAHAQAAMGKVGVINIQSAIIATKDGQKAAQELDAKAAPRRKTLESRQNEINALKDQLQTLPVDPSNPQTASVKDAATAALRIPLNVG